MPSRRSPLAPSADRRLDPAPGFAEACAGERGPCRPARVLVSLAVAAALLALGCQPRPPAATAPPPPPAAQPPALLAHGTLPGGTVFEGLEIGGLSDIDYDARRGIYWAVVDDVHGQPPARLLSLRWEPPQPPEPLGWLMLAEADGTPISGEGADLEGLALLPEGGFVVSAEGYVDGGRAPWVGRFDASGRLQERLPLPPHFAIAEGRGPRNNAALEALALTSDGGILAGMERSLFQDEPDTAADGNSTGPAPTRVLRWGAGGSSPREWIYLLDPPHARAALPGGLRVAGLVDLLPLPAGGLLAMERSFVAGRGFRVRLYETELADVAEVSGRADVAAGAARPPAKRLVLDLASLGVPVDNYEGIAWGPPGPDGEPTLVIASDNNFSRAAESHWVAVRWPR